MSTINNEATAQKIAAGFEGIFLDDAHTIALGQLNATLALVAAQTTANRIAWTTRPGYAPGPAVREWIEKEVGL